MKRAPFYSRRNLYKWAPYVGGTVLVVGVSAFLLTFFNNPPSTEPETKVRGPVDVGVQTGQRVKLSPEVQRVASRFIRTAVARRNLKAGWKLTHPELRSCGTYKEWIRGTSCVVYYPVDFSQPPPFRVDESYARRAELEVVLTPRRGSGVTKPQLFFIGLKKVGTGKNGRWLVYYWQPRSIPIVPKSEG